MDRKAVITISLITLFSICPAYALTFEPVQLTFDGIGGQALPNPGIPYTPQPCIYDVGQEWSGTPFHPNLKLYINDGTTKTYLESMDWEPEMSIQVISSQDDRVFWVEWFRSYRCGPLNMYHNGQIYSYFDSSSGVGGAYGVYVGPDYFVLRDLMGALSVVNTENGLKNYLSLDYNTKKTFGMPFWQALDIADDMQGITPYQNGFTFQARTLFWDLTNLTPNRGNTVAQSYETYWVAIPEPCTLLLLGIGAIAIRAKINLL